MPDIWFPNLNIKIDTLSRTAFSLFGLDVYWYGIFICTGIVLGTLVAMGYMKKIGGNPDDVMDFMLYAIIFCIIGARIYYVIFSWDTYKNDLIKIFKIREGGLAIYGGIIAALIFGVFFVRKRKLDFWHMADVIVPSVPLGQAIGRWGNFFNREAFGTYTDGLFAMRYKLAQVSADTLDKAITDNIITAGGTEYIQVHPTFLYESLWDLAVFIILVVLRKRGKRCMLAWYMILYGAGRMVIEGLRTDSLYVGNSPVRVSQALSAAIIVVGIAMLAFMRHKDTMKKIE